MLTVMKEECYVEKVQSRELHETYDLRHSNKLHWPFCSKLHVLRWEIKSMFAQDVLYDGSLISRGTALIHYKQLTEVLSIIICDTDNNQ